VKYNEFNACAASVSWVAQRSFSVHRSVFWFQVKYFDYGTIEVIPKTDLRLLDKQFIDIPMQGIKAKLSAIKPAKGAKSFSREVSEVFFKMVANKTLVGSVIRVLHDVS